MRRIRLLWRLVLSFLVLTFVSVLAIALLSSRSIRNFHVNKTAADLEIRSRLVGDQLGRLVQSGAYSEVDQHCKRLGRESGTRITVILPSGRVVADSDTDPAMMGNHADRPEFKDALAGRRGNSIRYSSTLETTMMYVATPLFEGDNVFAVVRSAISIHEIEEALFAMYRTIALGGVLVAAAAALAGLVLSRSITRPLDEIRRGAAQFARGRLDGRLSVGGSEEIGGLAAAMNEMASQLDERLRSVAQERNEREAILSSMVEGVVAVDSDERLITMNHAAARLFKIERLSVQGRGLREVIRNPDLHKLVESTLASATPVQGEIRLHDPEERVLEVQGAVLRDSEGRAIGVLVVLHDVTRLRRLEQVRKDFVANVSHELKTPITTIQGFVETLLAGALDSRKEARHFLGIVLKHTERLNAIIEDLLTLSGIEQSSEKKAFPLERGNVRDVLSAAVDTCGVRAEQKKIALELQCDDQIHAKINAPLLRQAVVNLIDNAIKFSEPGTRVTVTAVRRNGDVVIQVRDEGCGINPAHLPRLFERFYRVDMARSRELGGTGLGLAIVKHIALAHGGGATAESTPGEGSLFSIQVRGA